MTLAEDTREAARRRPALLGALRAGVVNYTAAARSLADEVEGDTETIGTALRRFAKSLPDRETEPRDVRVSMHSGLGVANTEGEDGHRSDGLLSVGETTLEPGAGSLTVIVAEGEVDCRALAHVLNRLDAEGVAVKSAGVADGTADVADGTLTVAVERRDGPDALRVVEDAVAAVPASLTELKTE